jgi:DNA-binding ferritin-like protein
MLEETQRDLEEAAAEVAERIRRLKDKEEQPAKA